MYFLKTLVFVLSLGSLVGAAAADVELTGLLAQYRGSLEPLRNSSMEVMFITRSQLRGRSEYSSMAQSICHRRGDRARCEYRRWLNVQDTSAPAQSELTEITDYGVNDGRLLGMKRTGRGSDHVAFVMHGVPEHQLVSWQGPVLSGYFPGDDGRIDAILESSAAAIRRTPEWIDGVQCFVIDAKTRDTAYTVWIAPARDYAILRMHRLISGHRLEELNKQFLGPAPDGEARQPSNSDRWMLLTQKLEDVQLELIDGNWIPVRARLSEETVHAEGSPSRGSTTIERDRVTLNSSAEGLSFEPHIPNGTKVVFWSAPNPIAHEWIDGKIVPRENKETIAALDTIARGRRFPPAGQRSVILADHLSGPVLFAAGTSALLLLLSVISHSYVRYCRK